MDQVLIKYEQIRDERCRVCLECREGSICLLNTTNINDLTLSYWDLLVSISNIEIENDGNVPQSICTACAERAEASYEFKLLCESSDRVLQNESAFQNENVICRNVNDLKSEKLQDTEVKDVYYTQNRIYVPESITENTKQFTRDDPAKSQLFAAESDFTKLYSSIDVKDVEDLSFDSTTKNSDDSTDLPDQVNKKNEHDAIATTSLLPAKSRELYDKEYSKFQSWMQNNCVEIINETVLQDYFEELSETFSPNSLWTKYSMLRKTLQVNKNIDIGKYHKLGEYLKQRSKGYKTKKSKVLTREQVLKFVHEAPNKQFLMVKVALLFGVFGGCRRQELVNMLVEHIEDRGSVVVINIPETKTDKKRVFTIIELNEMDCLRLFREYASLRPQGCSLTRFFLNYRNGCCTRQPVGKNTFGKIPSIIAKYLGLTEADKYTGHCLRRTSASLLANAGPYVSTLKRHGGWKSSTDADGYLEDDSSRNKISRMLVDEPSTSASYFEESSVSTDEAGPSVGTSTSGNISLWGHSVSAIST